MQVRILKMLVLFAVVLAPLRAVEAASSGQVSRNGATLDFPDTVTFAAALEAAAPIQSVTLEYGSRQSTCGDVIAKAFPQFTPGTSVQVEWTWDMRQSGSLPPGATIWWRWHFTDETGKETVSDQQTVTWLDSVHKWQMLTADLLRLHWYGIQPDFAQTMLSAAEDGLKFNQQQAGLSTTDPIDIYVYPNYTDMRDAILYEPSWTGGTAFSAYNIVILGLSGGDSNWDRGTIIHELTHVLVGHLTFSCLGSVPTWLDEGLAVYSEGELDPELAGQLQEAIRQDKLLSVRSLSAGFSEVRDKAILSYSESYSIVKFLIETYGQQKVTELLTSLRDGDSVDEALLKVYGFDVEGLEDAWRKGVGAAARPVSARPTAVPTPTFVPTMIPVSGGQLAMTATPFAVPTSSFGTPPTPGTGYGPPLGLTLSLLAFCCIFGILIGVIILGVIARRPGRKGGANG
ncbi:MAG: peptidase MA family metallohydrolase [Bacteroidota bacterium]